MLSHNFAFCDRRHTRSRIIMAWHDLIMVIVSCISGLVNAKREKAAIFLSNNQTNSDYSAEIYAFVFFCQNGNKAQAKGK